MTKLFVPIGLLSLSTACAIAELEMPTDEDGDGILSDEEAELGLDPENPDSDGDGAADGAELDGNTDPTDAADYPYTGGWDKGSCKDETVGTGTGVGDIMDDMTAVDQFGQEVRLHDFCHKAILLVSGAFW